mgnify:FL=1
MNICNFEPQPTNQSERHHHYRYMRKNNEHDDDDEKKPNFNLSIYKNQRKFWLLFECVCTEWMNVWTLNPFFPNPCY